MATFLEQLKDGIANALGIEDKPQNIQRLNYGKGVVIPRLKPLPTINRGKSLAEEQLAVNSKQNTEIKSLARQIEELKKQDLLHKQMLLLLKKQLKNRKIRASKYSRMAKTIADNQRTIKQYKTDLYRQKQWINNKMNAWKRQNAHKKTNNNSAYMLMMKKQMQLLERIANNNVKQQRALINRHAQKKNTNYRGNKLLKELNEIRRELSVTQSLLKNSKNKRLVRLKPIDRKIAHIRKRNAIKTFKINTRHNRKIARIKRRHANRPIRRKRFRKIVKRASWLIPQVAAGRMIAKGIKKIIKRKPLRKKRRSIRRRNHRQIRSIRRSNRIARRRLRRRWRRRRR